MADMADTDHRLEFERWCLVVGFGPTRDARNGYRNAYTLMAWRGWAGRAGVPLEPWGDGAADGVEMVPEPLRVELASLRKQLAIDEISVPEFERKTTDARQRYQRAIAAA